MGMRERRENRFNIDTILLFTSTVKKLGEYKAFNVHLKNNMGCKWKPGECQGKCKGGEKTECENCSGSSWTLGDSERAETTAKSQRWGKPQARFEHGQLHSKQISSADNCRVKCLPCATRLKLPTGAFSKKHANKMSMHSYNMLSRERKRIKFGPRTPAKPRGWTVHTEEGHQSWMLNNIWKKGAVRKDAGIKLQQNLCQGNKVWGREKKVFPSSFASCRIQV